ncbi:hypothetical protein PoB_000406700 [Plakobranchus ocellatus]|uniref:Uncharacterized protein n=1 Tax=Plakobranchus ocellatus TaxID=259542 RepID=A0AAV3Y550_9GAST|nr:hypothetical protein PoB_000406700 [Plakobranchus ocellatus]
MEGEMLGSEKAVPVVTICTELGDPKRTRDLHVPILRREIGCLEVDVIRDTGFEGAVVRKGVFEESQLTGFIGIRNELVEMMHIQPRAGSRSPPETGEFLQFESENVASPGTKMVHNQHSQVRNFCRGGAPDSWTPIS